MRGGSVIPGGRQLRGRRDRQGRRGHRTHRGAGPRRCAVRPRGTPDQFLDSYDPSWGRFATSPIRYPAITSTARRGHGYYDYFGPAAGDRRQGWYWTDPPPRGHGARPERPRSQLRAVCASGPGKATGRPARHPPIRRHGGQGRAWVRVPVATARRATAVRGACCVSSCTWRATLALAPWPGWTLPMRGRTEMPLSPRRCDRTAGLIVDDARLRPGRRRPPMDRRGGEEGR